MNKVNKIGLLFCLMFLAVAVGAQLPDIQREAYLTGLSSPVFITNAGDGTNRMFVVQQRGLIKVVQPGSTTATNFIDLSGVVSQTGSERGLLGLAFHPDFANNSFFFVNYTRSSDGATVIARYKAISNNTIGDQGSAFTIITIPQDFSNHNGGNIGFGPDDNLYIGMGDGGSGNDPNNRAQNINSLLGKMLRITPSLAEPAFGALSYTIPGDNPFVGVPGSDEIFAVGLRNPYRWSFDRGGTNQLWAGDVGQNAIEEVTIVENGGNYGWRVYEGTSCTNNDPKLCTPSNFDPPVFQYSHSAGRCSITGGYVYRGNGNTFDQGNYIYGDFCTGEYWLWDGVNQTLIENTPRNISGFGEDEAGELYLVHLGGTVEKIININAPQSAANADFDGDGLTDITVFRPDGGSWFSLRSATNTFDISQFGANGDTPVPEDYDGDGRTDVAVFRPSESVWYVFRSSDSTVDIASFGQSGDIPATGDFAGDGTLDIALFRPSEGKWYVADDFPDGSTTFVNVVSFGSAGDIPVAGDYDGDGRHDLAVYRPSEGVWYSTNVDSTGLQVRRWGLATDIAAPGDFDGDGTTDLNVFRPSEGNWYTFLSATGGFRAIKWGIDGDIPVPGEYDGDGSTDTAIWRPSTGEWYVLKSSDFTFFAGPLGVSTDLPVPAYDIP
jgi:glucose/arabinose dehydrogenase